MALALAGCKVNEPEQKLGLPLSICLPANEVQSARYAPAARRAIGDPGETELFLFPHYLYIIVMKQDNTTKVWSVWHAEERTLKDADWKPTRYVGLLPTMGDSIYQYTEQINLLLTAGGSKFYGRVYAVASAEPLSFNKALSSSGITSLDDLLDLTFNTSEVQSSLQHIYSSPYNLTQNGDYYGSFNSNFQRVPYVNLLLYHVAAKVDIKWNVEEDKRINKADRENAVRLTYMEARNLFNGNAYCFKPMRNVSGSALTSGATVKIAENDEGLWWEGRSYFYTIPYTVEEAPNYFPLQMTLKTNGSAGTGYQPTLNLRVDTTAKFVPWLRANFNLTAPLENKTETKTVDN